MRTAEQALEEALDYLRTEVRPRAQEIDRDPEALRRALRGLADRDLLAMRRPVSLGGPDLNDRQFRTFQEEVARASGVLAFLQTQHQSAVSMLLKAENSDLAAEYVPRMGNGDRGLGIGFSQLRRPGPPMVRAEACDDGYRVTGTVPWVTGWDFFEEFLLGAQLPDGRAVFAVVPLRSQPGIRISEPMQLAAMASGNTVEVDLDGYFIPGNRVAFIRPPGWIKNNDMINVALQGHFAIGCAQAGVDIVREAGAKRNAEFVLAAADALQAEIEACREATANAQQSVSEETTQERLEVRAWAIDLAGRCGHAAITASSGGANYLDHPAQRVYREALVFTVSAQTTAIMEATLRRLIRPTAAES